MSPNSVCNTMSLVLDIVPCNDAVDMFGDPDPSVAYSLSGHLAVSVAPSSSFFDARRPVAHVLLQSLVLTFEGQSEIFSRSTGYSSLRLCAITQELVPGEPLELSNEDNAWNIVFNLTIPGWLPTSTPECLGDFGVKYSLSATARFTSPDGSALAALCAPFRSRFRSAEAYMPITLRRYIDSPHDILDTPLIHYLVQSTPGNAIPADVMSTIEVLVSLPDFVDVETAVLPLALRLRTNDLREEECAKLQLTHMSLDILQHEQFRPVPTPSYLAQYPIPKTEMQPPNLPLRHSHPMAFLYGGCFSTGRDQPSSRTSSIHKSGLFKLDKNNYIFKDDRTEQVPSWYTIKTVLPFDKSTHPTFETDGTLSWSDCRGLRPSACGPLYSVHHQVAISLTISYDLECGGVVREKLNFKIPVTFANIAPANLLPSHCSPSLAGLGGASSNGEMSSPPASSSSTSSSSSSSSSSTPLPAYSQLYDRNGERKIDYSVPLPLYTPKDSPRARDGNDTKDNELADSGKQEKHPWPSWVSTGLVGGRIAGESASFHV